MSSSSRKTSHAVKNQYFLQFILISNTLGPKKATVSQTPDTSLVFVPVGTIDNMLAWPYLNDGAAIFMIPIYFRIYL